MPFKTYNSRPVIISTQVRGVSLIITARCFITARHLGVALEPFVEVNHNSYLHDSKTFGGVPQRYRDILTDFTGYTAELLAKSINQNKLDQPITHDEKHDLLVAMKGWGLLGDDFTYSKGNLVSSRRRFYQISRRRSRRCANTIECFWAGGGHAQRPVAMAVFQHELRDANDDVPAGRRHGYDRQSRSLSSVGDLVTHNIKVSVIQQDGSGITVIYNDNNSSRHGRAGQSRLLRLHDPALGIKPA